MFGPGLSQRESLVIIGACFHRPDAISFTHPVVYSQNLCQINKHVVCVVDEIWKH